MIKHFKPLLKTRWSILCVSHQMICKIEKRFSWDQLCVMKWWIVKWYQLVLDDTGSVYGDTGWYLVVLGQYKLVPGGTRSLWGGTGWPMVVMGRYGVVLGGTWWYWVSLTWYCLVLSGTGLVQRFYACIYWKKMDISPDVTIAGQRRWTREDRATQPTINGWDEQFQFNERFKT